jgi:hypothetical protein
MGVDPCGREDGRDASELLRNANAVAEGTPAQLHHASTKKAGIVTHDYLYAIHENGEAMMFDRKNDPLELNNLSTSPKHAAIRGELLKQIVSHHAAVDSPATVWLKEWSE